jgi:hypothetical protein
MPTDEQNAKVAVAGRILTLCFYGLSHGEIRRLAPRRRRTHGQRDGGHP